MARNDDCDGIVAVGPSHGARGTLSADLFGDFSIRRGFSVRNRQQRLPYSPLKLGAAQFEFDVEVGELAGKLGGELLDGVAKCPGIR